MLGGVSTITSEQLHTQAMRARAARIQIARRDVNTMCELVLRDEFTGGVIEQAPVHVAWHDLIDKNDRLVLWSHVESGKCLGLGTPVLRYDGTAVPVEEVREGDQLMGPDSTPRTVLSTTCGSGPLYRIVPRKGEPWICNDVHMLTLVHTVTGEVSDIGLDEYLNRSGWWKSNHKLFQPENGVDFAPTDEPLPVSPYFVGVWLGDGTKSLHSVQVSKPDAEIEFACRAEAVRFGLRVTVQDNGRCPTFSIVGERGGPGANPLLSAMQKMMRDQVRVPYAYLTASREVRLEVLAGLLDTDGYCYKCCFEITQRRRAIADDVMFLARSVGLRATLRRKRVKGCVYWRVMISGETSIVPTRIARKTARPRIGGKNSLRTGFDVEAIGEGEYAGFTLDGDGRFLLGDFTITHNTSQIAVGKAIHLLGQNSSRRGAIVSNTYHQAEKIVGAVGAYIENSSELHAIFPELRPSEPWTRAQITVQRDRIARDPSLQACGVHGNILGARLDFLILDDVLDFENTRTPKHRQDLHDWFVATLLGRLTKNAIVIIIGNAWHPEDLMHKLAGAPEQGWVGRAFPLVNADGSVSWPSQWPQDRIDAKRAELGPLEFARQMMCKARDETDARFRRKWIEDALEAGIGCRTVLSLAELWNMPGMADYAGPEWLRERDAEYIERIAETLQAIDVLPTVRTYTGVDLGVSRKAGSAETVLFTIVVLPDGKRQVINIDAGRLSGPEIVGKIISAHDRYNSIVIVENVAAQDYLLQFVRQQNASIPIVPFTTGAGKSHPEYGIESLAAELAAGLWRIPCSKRGEIDPQVEKWIEEMLYYQPTAHTGDRLMACWFAREAAKRSERRSAPTFRARVIG